MAYKQSRAVLATMYSVVKSEKNFDKALLSALYKEIERTDLDILDGECIVEFAQGDAIIKPTLKGLFKIASNAGLDDLKIEQKDKTIIRSGEYMGMSRKITSKGIEEALMNIITDSKKEAFLPQNVLLQEEKKETEVVEEQTKTEEIIQPIVPNTPEEPALPITKDTTEEPKKVVPEAPARTTLVGTGLYAAYNDGLNDDDDYGDEENIIDNDEEVCF